MKRLVGLCILALGGLLAIGKAEAQACGANLTANTVLTADMNCTAVNNHGLVLQAGITLDCNGHTITGKGGAVGQQTGFYGIYVRASNAIVKNCRVQAYEIGVRVRQANNVQVINTISENNTRYGMELTNNSNNALIDSNLIQNNGDEGFHVSAGGGSTFVHNTLTGQRLEALYFLNTNNNVARENTFFDNGSAAIYVKTSNNNIIDSNVMTNDPIQLVQGATGNQLINNNIIDARLNFDGASNNTVSFNTVQRTAAGNVTVPAYQFKNSAGIVITDSEVCGPVTDQVFAFTTGTTATNVTFTRFFLLDPPVRANVDALSTVTMDATGVPIRCARAASVDVEPGHDKRIDPRSGHPARPSRAEAVRHCYRLKRGC